MSTIICAIATAVPDHRLEPAAVIAQLRHWWPQLDRLDDATTSAGTRYTCEPLERLLQPRTLTEQTASYLKHGRRLAGDAAREALRRAGVAGRDVDMVITVSCTGYLVPSLDVHLAEELGLRPDVIRIPLTELGCSGGAAAIALAHRHLLAYPAHRVLVIAVELPSLTFRSTDHSLDNMTAALVFGDGAGSALLTGQDRPGLAVVKTASQLVPSTAGLLGFDLRDGGFHVVLDRRLPRILLRELRPLVERFTAAAGLDSLDFLVAHAGGPRIFEAVETALGLDSEVLEGAREVFATVGNTSSAAIFFALERLVGSLGAEPKEGLGLGLGPGITIELMHLAWTPSENPGDESGALGERLPVGR